MVVRFKYVQIHFSHLGTLHYVVAIIQAKACVDNQDKPRYKKGLFLIAQMGRDVIRPYFSFSFRNGLSMKL